VFKNISYFLIVVQLVITVFSGDRHEVLQSSSMSPEVQHLKLEEAHIGLLSQLELLDRGRGLLATVLQALLQQLGPGSITCQCSRQSKFLGRPILVISIVCVLQVDTRDCGAGSKVQDEAITTVTIGCQPIVLSKDIVLQSEQVGGREP
jgi:hypothetical protein